MKTTQCILLAGLGSLMVLLGAFGFQFIGEMAPCNLCIWQRYPHVLAIIFAVLAYFSPQHWVKGILLSMGALSMLTTAAIGIYHAGVERGIFEGPNSCTSNDIDQLSAEELMSQIMQAPLVRCDEIAWQMLGISMAGWNAIVSLALCCLWLQAYRGVKNG